MLGFSKGLRSSIVVDVEGIEGVGEVCIVVEMPRVIYSGMQ